MFTHVPCRIPPQYEACKPLLVDFYMRAQQCFCFFITTTVKKIPHYTKPPVTFFVITYLHFEGFTSKVTPFFGNVYNKTSTDRYRNNLFSLFSHYHRQEDTTWYNNKVNFFSKLSCFLLFIIVGKLHNLPVFSIFTYFTYVNYFS